jgi:hypothetical protein
LPYRQATPAPPSALRIASRKLLAVGDEKISPTATASHQPVAHVAQEGRLVPGAAAGDDAHLAALRGLHPLHHARVVLTRLHGVGVGHQPAGEHVLDHQVGVVDDAVHGHGVSPAGATDENGALDQRRASVQWMSDCIAV